MTSGRVDTYGLYGSLATPPDPDKELDMSGALPLAQSVLSMSSFAVIAALLSGCSLDPLSDPPLDLEVQPLEVVVNSSTAKSPCILNVERVRAGEHQVSVIGESGYARVSIMDEYGHIVFRTDNAGQRVETDDDGEVTIYGEGGTSTPARLEAGTFTVLCRPKNGEDGETTLRVLPARPGR